MESYTCQGVTDREKRWARAPLARLSATSTVFIPRATCARNRSTARATVNAELGARLRHSSFIVLSNCIASAREPGSVMSLQVYRALRTEDRCVRLSSPRLWTFTYRSTRIIRQCYRISQLVASEKICSVPQFMPQTRLGRSRRRKYATG